MESQCKTETRGAFTGTMRIVLALLLSLLLINEAFCQSKAGEPALKKVPSPKSMLKLEEIPYKIVYESYRSTNGRENWELFLMNADGSNSINLTHTPEIDELYPHVSPDGTKICFVADEGTSRRYKVRSVYYMNIDGTNRVKVAENTRQPCWSPDGKTIAYAKCEYERYSTRDYSTQGLFFYNIESGEHKQHPNNGLQHLYNICYSPDGNWFLATVHGGMGYEHAILAIEAEGTGVFDLTKFKVTGCRPDCKFDGRQITWGATDWDLCVGNIDLSSSEPKVTDVHTIVTCEKECEVYHTDFSPDGKCIVFSYGPEANEQVGGKAPGWNICGSDLAGTWVQVTTDGNQNKEPDWVPVRTTNR